MKNSFKEMTFTELVQKRAELKTLYENLKIDSVIGHLDNPLQIRIARRQISRLNCLIYNHSEVKELGE